MKENLDTAIAAHEYWRGRPRACPECSETFVSQGDRGQCTNCQHVFYASHPELGDTDWWREDEPLQPTEDLSVGWLSFLRLFPFAWWHLGRFPWLSSVKLGVKGKYRVTVWIPAFQLPPIGKSLLERARHPFPICTESSWNNFELLLEQVGMDRVDLDVLPYLINRFGPSCRIVLRSDDDLWRRSVPDNSEWEDPVENEYGFVFYCNDIILGNLECLQISHQGKVTNSVVGKGFTVDRL